MERFNDFLRTRLSHREKQGLIRRLSTSEVPVDFSSNDYLGLARSPELARSIEALHASLGVRNGASGSRLLTGNSTFTLQVEDELSKIFRSEATLLFNSGYSANLAVLSSVPQKGDTILYDNLAHASLKDGARLSLASRYSFQHNDLADLEQKLKRARGQPFIVVESIYSMDGDTCPLPEIVALAQTYNAVIILDEAHSTGVVGPAGAGYCVEKGLEDKVPIRIYTFGKGMGVHGACVAGSNRLIQYLVNFARPFIYTTAISQHEVISIRCAFRLLSAHQELQAALQKKIALYLRGAGQLPNRTPSVSAIQTILCPGHEAVRHMANELQREGFDVRPILSPTVPEGKERLRICLHSFNTDEEINALTGLLVHLLGS